MMTLEPSLVRWYSPDMEYIYHYDSPLGGITIACDGAAITRLYFEGHNSNETSAHENRVTLDRCEGRLLPVIRQTRLWLDTYFRGGDPGFTPPLKPSGTAFRKEVWGLLLTIPYGTTVTYGDLAKALASSRGGRMSAQAVGGAVAKNPIPLLIPCHRVIGSDCSLTGYSQGLDKKAWLLEFEGARF